MRDRHVSARVCYSRNVSIGAIAIAMLVAGNPAIAQVQPAAPPAATDSSARTNADIVVTAQKRNERLQDVPIAITVIDSALLQSTNSRNFAELQGAVPGVYFAGNSGGGRTYITLRGATGLALNTGDEPVAIYQDDIYLARGVTVGMADLLDVGSVEIVRGPQGTLQGRNATAGAILLRSADPTRDFEGRLSASVADPQEYRIQGSLSGPLGGGFGGRFAAGYVNDRGWAFNPFTGKHIGGAESYQARGVVTYESGDFKARIVADYGHVNNQPAIFRYAATTFNPIPTGQLVLVPTPNTPLPQAQRDEIFKHDRISLNPGSDTTVENGGISANLSYSFGNIDLISVTGWRKAHVEGTNDSDGLDTSRMGYNHNDDRSTQFSQELRLQSSGDQPFSWILGAYMFDENQFYVDDIYNLRFSLPRNQVQRFTGNIYTRSYAAFADATIKLTDTLSAIGGIRYTRDEKRISAAIITTNLDTGVVTNVPYILAGQTSAPEDVWTDTSYRAKLVYKPSRDLMFFIGYGRGFRSGGYNPFAIQAAYSPEINKSLEGGSKGDLLDRRLSYSIAVYRNVYSNLQLRAGVPTGGAIITNAAKALIKGVELELTARPTEHTRINANLAYTDAKFTSFPTARNTLDQQVDASGNVLPRTPKWQYFISAEHDIPLGGDLLLTPEINYRWRGKIYFFFTDQNVQPWQDPSGDELGARLSLRPEDSRWTFSVYGTNLTNSRIINTAAVTFSYPQVGLNKPRVIGASASVKF